jgi:hypothetical protein
MPSKYALATACAVSVMALAGAAHAGGNTIVVTGNPDPSTLGQSVLLTATRTATSCTSPVDFVDITEGGPPATLCSSDFDGNTVASCSADFNVEGERVVTAIVNEGSGCDDGGVQSHVQSVVAPVAEVPTMAEWTLWGFAGALLLGGGALIARRSRRFS